MPNRLIFFGTEQFSRPSLRALIEAGYDVAAVVTKPDSPRSRGRQAAKPAVKRLAETEGITVFQPEDLAGLGDDLARLRPEAGVLVAYGRIIPAAVIDTFPLGIVNLHPSDLPRYRGPSPIEQALLNGDDQTAVSLMKLVETMDAGPVYAKRPVPIAPGATKPQLYQTLAQAGAELLVENLPDILSGKLSATPQEDAQASYTRLLKKTDGQIDWQLPAGQIERQIRAFLGWPGSFTELFGVRITILSAGTADKNGPAGEHYVSSDGRLGVYAGSDSVVIDRLKPAGRKAMDSADFLRGYRR